MIARIWQAITMTSEADSYAEYLDAHILPGYRKAEGNQGIFVLRSTQGEITHFLLLSLWSSHEKLHRFAGPDEGKIRLPEEEKCYLVAFESIVKHYEVISKID
jgi:heme-degrading monooxygenase HmoA